MKRILVVVLLMMLLPSTTLTCPKFEVARVKDGDTIDVRGQLWPGLYQAATIRLDGINAAEIHSHRPCEARDARVARDRVIELTKDGVYLENINLSLYKRWTAIVLLPDGTNLNQLLVSEGLAINYDGQAKRPEWVCK